jgi:hypothetical protein
MANIVCNEFRKYFNNLTATNAICVALGTTFVSGTNLFVLNEPSNDVATRCLTIIPYGGAPPSPEGDRQESYVQIRLKTPYPENGLRTMQQIINSLHGNMHVCASNNGKVYAIQSSPIPYGYGANYGREGQIEGGEYYIFVSNYRTKHIKL